MAAKPRIASKYRIVNIGAWANVFAIAPDDWQSGPAGGHPGRGDWQYMPVGCGGGAYIALQALPMSTDKHYSL
jgi:hypothetical protein